MKVVGITGQIGSGKTTIAALLRKEGYVVFDVDNWCRGLYHNVDFLAQIQKYFPQSFINGVFSKPKLRQIVFSDNKSLKKLERLTHPFLKRKFLKSIQKNSCYRGVFFVDVALLFEMGWDKYCSYKIMAYAPYEVQQKRVMARDKVSKEQVDAIIKIQEKTEKLKKKNIDFVINTDKPLGVLKTQVIKLAEILEC